MFMLKFKHMKINFFFAKSTDLKNKVKSQKM